MAIDLIEKTENYVFDILDHQISDDFKYHDTQHTRSVVHYSREFAQMLSISDEEIELLHIAALFHDTGYTKVYTGHEEASKGIAVEFLTKEGLEPEKIKVVERLIEATIPTRPPNDILEEIIKDADLNNLGSTAFDRLGGDLRHEWKVFLKEDVDDEEWCRRTLAFLKGHNYFTWPAQEKFGNQKKKNIKSVKKDLKKLRKPAEVKKGGAIAASRSAQMMFKTALRNHIDLTNIADNKANMMLSINAIVISITMPLLATQVEDNMFLLVPASILLTTCVLSIIYATLATRPIKMNGLTSMERVKEGNSNLFFFGNFYNMDNPTYREGINHVIEREDMLETTIINDLYYLGKALGNKYNQLRTCYAIFMIGITVTVIAFAISFFMAMNG